jgi:hypothetical protein
MADGLIAVSRADNTDWYSSISIPNIVDNNSVKAIKYELLASDSGVAVKSGDSQYTENADSIDLRRTFFANTFNISNGKYKLKFSISDIAGNISILEKSCMSTLSVQKHQNLWVFMTQNQQATFWIYLH